MYEIGIRELRDGFSGYLAEVRRGKTITITRYGKPVGRLEPVDRPTALQRLLAEGRVRRPTD